MTKLGRITLTNGAHLLLIDSGESDRGSTRTLAASGVSTATGGGDGGNPFDRLVPIPAAFGAFRVRSEEHTSDTQSLMRISTAVFWLTNTKKNKKTKVST